VFGVTAAAADPVGPVGRPFADATPAQIRAALTPEDAESFERHWRALMQRAMERLDLTEVHDALAAWRQTAMVTSASGVEGYRRMMRTAEERLRTGERAPGAVPWRQASSGQWNHPKRAMPGHPWCAHSGTGSIEAMWLADRSAGGISATPSGQTR